MRTALALPVGLALALASSSTRADPPRVSRVSMRLDYARGQGAETCPAEPAALRAEVARAMGYDPFEPGDAATAERLSVIVSRQGRGFAARIERYAASGALAWSETFPGRGETCASLLSPLATELRALLLTFHGAPANPPPEPKAPSMASPPPSAAPLAPPVRAANPPEPPNVPNPSRVAASRVAIVAYALSAAFTGLGIAWTVHAENKGNDATSLAARLQKAAGDAACVPMDGVISAGCRELVSARQSADTAGGYRNAWFIIAGTFAAVGVMSTVVAFSLPSTIKGQPTALLTINPTGLFVQGSF